MITHIIKADCGCEFEISNDGSFTSCRWCPLHKSAKEMYEALKEAITVLASNLYNHPDDAILKLQYKLARKALAKAKGKQ